MLKFGMRDRIDKHFSCARHDRLTALKYTHMQAPIYHANKDKSKTGIVFNYAKYDSSGI